MTRIGTVEDVTFLAPCVSHNRRLYSPEMVRKAGERLIARVNDPAGLPVTVRTHHAADDNSAMIAGRVANPRMDENGAIKGDVIIADTGAGRDMLALTTPDSDGKRFLDSMSIRGFFLGPVEKIERDGETLTTSNDLEIDGVDFTATPGVDQARLAQVRQSRETEEGTGRTPITESIGPVKVVVEPTVEAAAPPMSKRGSGHEGTGGPYADPGYQPDKKQRYQLSTKAQVRAAWSYINQGDNAAKYTGAQLDSIKSKIKAAAKKFGIEISSESESVVSVRDQLAEAVANLEAMVGVSAMQGPADVTVSAYGVDNADVAAATALVGQAAAAALLVLDPDQDNDMDLPGDDDGAADADNASGDDDGVLVSTLCSDCMVEVPADAKFCPQCGGNFGAESRIITTRNGVTEMGPTKCPGCKGDVPADAKFCPNCGANTKTKESAAPEQNGETSVTESNLSSDDVKRIAEQLAAAMRPAAATEAAPAATEAAPAATEAAPAVTEASIAAAVAAAVAESQEKMTVAFGQVMTNALTEQRDSIRAELLEKEGPQRRGLAERVQSVPIPDATPIHTLPPHEQKIRRDAGLAAQFEMAGYSMDIVDAVKPRSHA